MKRAKMVVETPNIPTKSVSVRPAEADTAKLAEGVAAVSISTPEDGSLPPHRSHDPQYNQKRSDPFQFGSRFLGESDDVFEFNAWDHVEVDDTYKEYAEQQYAMQRGSPVSDFDKREYTAFLNLFNTFEAAPKRRL